jgi:hypothetical protein
MSQVTHLASGALTRSGDTISIELHQPLDHPSFLIVVWPQKPSVTAATQSISSVGERDGPLHGGGADGTRREDQEQPMKASKRL